MKSAFNTAVKIVYGLGALIISLASGIALSFGAKLPSSLIINSLALLGISGVLLVSERPRTQTKAWGADGSEAPERPRPGTVPAPPASSTHTPIPSATSLAAAFAKNEERYAAVEKKDELLRARYGNYKRSLEETILLLNRGDDPRHALQEGMDVKSGKLGQFAAVIQDLSLILNDLIRAVLEKSKDMKDLSTKAQGGAALISENSRLTEAAEQAAKQVLGFVEAINDIAEEINVLGMNAAIEAAHAGSAGKGFAVIAGEIRKLSANATIQAKQISSRLQAMADGLLAVRGGADRTSSFFGEIIGAIREGSDELSTLVPQVQGVEDKIFAMIDSLSSLIEESERERNTVSATLEWFGSLEARLETAHDLASRLGSPGDGICKTTLERGSGGAERHQDTKGGAMKQNCWEFKKCGRNPGGAKVSEMGVCPAAGDASNDGVNGGSHSGRLCWAVAGTFCGGKVQGTFADKQLSCMTCEFFKQVKSEESRETFVMRR